MFRLPRGAFDEKAAELYCYTDAVSLTETDDHLIVSPYADREPGDEWLAPGGELAAMVQARSELAAGNLRLRVFNCPHGAAPPVHRSRSQGGRGTALLRSRS
jgi:hypothetical protein